MPTPNPHYQVIGKVTLSGTSQAQEGATVTVTDTTLNENTSATTNSAGEYAIDLTNLTSAFSVGDSLSITATYGNRSKTETSTIDNSPGRTINFVLDITSYPDYDDNFTFNEQSIILSAKDLMDRDIVYTRDTSNRVTKEVHSYGKFTITRFFTYNSDGAIVNENYIVT